MDPRRAPVHKIWIAAAIVFAIGFLVAIFTGSPFLAIICLAAAGGCGYASRRPPLVESDGDGDDDGDEDDDGKDEDAKDGED